MKNSNLKKVVITGSKGHIGSILIKDLADEFDFYLIDIKEKDSKKTFKIDLLEEYQKLVDVFRGKDAVIHLSWNFFEDFPKETIDYKNKSMVENVYKAAIESGVKRVIVASSVHANKYSLSKNRKNFDIRYPLPDSPYGASKIYIEVLGNYYAKHHNLEVICLRFGGLNNRDVPIFEEDPLYDKVLLYKQDAVDLVRACIQTKRVPNNFQILTAVSNNKNRVHIIKNFLGWQPKLPKS